ncbi:MAG: hypothetical protein ACI90V_010165, partial [Bacillariaceae sp.]
SLRLVTRHAPPSRAISSIKILNNRGVVEAVVIVAVAVAVAVVAIGVGFSIIFVAVCDADSYDI